MSESEAIEQFKLMGIYREEDRQKLRFAFGDVAENQSTVRIETATSTRILHLITAQEESDA